MDNLILSFDYRLKQLKIKEKIVGISNRPKNPPDFFSTPAFFV